MNYYRKRIREVLKPTVDTEEGKSCKVPTRAYYEWYMKEAYPSVLSEYTRSFRKFKPGEDENDTITLPEGTELIDILPQGDLEVAAYGSVYSPEKINEELKIYLKPESFEVFAGIRNGNILQHIGFISILYLIKDEDVENGLEELGFSKEHIFFLKKILVYDQGTLIKEEIFTEVPFSSRKDSFDGSITLFTATITGKIKPLIYQTHSYYKELLKHAYAQKKDMITEGGDSIERRDCKL